MSPTTGSNALAASNGVSGLSGVVSTGTVCALVCASRRSKGSDSRGVLLRIERRAPRLLERLGERGFLVEQLLRAVAQPPGFEQRDHRARGQQVGQQVLVGGEPRQPRLHPVEGLALRQPFPLLGAPLLRVDELGGAGAHVGGRQQLAHREDPGVGDRVGRSLVGDRELRQPVDLVAPEVDAHRVVGRRGIDVDDRPAHRELAARLHLVLAPVAHRHEPFDELVAVELVAGPDHDRLDVFDVRAEPLHERAHRCDDDRGEMVAAGPQPPDHAQPAAHRLGRRRARVRTAASPTRGRARPRRRRGTRAGRRRGARPRCPSAPRARPDGGPSPTPTSRRTRRGPVPGPRRACRGRWSRPRRSARRRAAW